MIHLRQFHFDFMAGILKNNLFPLPDYRIIGRQSFNEFCEHVKFWFKILLSDTDTARQFLITGFTFTQTFLWQTSSVRKWHVKRFEFE